MAVALGGLLPAPTFDGVGEPETLNQRWTLWKDELNLYLLASGVTDPAQKCALMLHTGGVGLRAIYSNFTEEDKREGEDDNAYDVAIKLMDGHFKLKKNVPKARQNFIDCVPTPGEAVNNFVVRLKGLALHCEFKQSDNQIRDHVVHYIKDSGLKSKLLTESEDLTLTKMSEIIATCNRGANILTPEHNSDRINVVNIRRSSKYSAPQRRTSLRCYRCNAIGHFSRDCYRLRARDHVCEKCNKKGHFAICCITKVNKSNNSPHPHSQPQRTPNFQHTASSRGRGRGRGALRRIEEEKNSKEESALYVFTIDPKHEDKMHI